MKIHPLLVIPTVFVLLTTFPAAYFGQTLYQNRNAATFEAFKFADVGESPREEWEKELVRFADAGKDYPGSRLAIIVYAESRSKRTSIDAISSQYRNFLKEYIGESRSIRVDPGGYRTNFSAELWIVSKDDWPKPTPDAPFEPEYLGEIGDVTKEEFERLLAIYWKKLDDEPSHQRYLINYGSDKEIARREKIITESITFRNHDRSRITLVRGGDKYPGSRMTTLWSIPPGASNPNP